MSVLIQNSAPDCMHILVSLMPAILTRLEHSFNLSVLTATDKEQKEGVQGLLCGLIQVLTLEMDTKDIETNADTIMTCLVRVMQSTG